MHVFRCVLACAGLAVFGVSLSGADVRGRALEILRTHAQDGHRVISEYNALPLEFSSFRDNDPLFRGVPILCSTSRAQVSPESCSLYRCPRDLPWPDGP